MISNNDEDPSHYLTFRISSAFQKWNELKHVLTDRRIKMSSRINIIEGCVRSRLLYSTHAWELSAREMSKLETILHDFLRKMITNGFKRKNVPRNNCKRERKFGLRNKKTVINDFVNA